MSTKIMTLDQLRNKVLETFEKLADGEIDIQQAATLGKLNDSVISGLMAEMKYAVLTESIPHIPFFDNSQKFIEGSLSKKMIDNK